MKGLAGRIARNLWVLLLDILAVNAAYYLGLVIRFSTNLEIKPEAMDPFLPGYTHFAPFYTVIAVVVFYLFRLYGGMWRYAGLNDMNRIIGANAVTCVIQVVGTILFVKRMPISYYIIGAVLQFVFIVIIRFSSRFFLAERQRIASRKESTVATVVVGAGDMGRRAVQHFTDHTAFGVSVIYDEKSAGMMQDGIRVVGGEFEEVLKTYEIEAICIADTKLTSETKKAIKKACDDQGLELIDFTGKFSNLGGSISLTALLEKAAGPVEIVIAGDVYGASRSTDVIGHTDPGTGEVSVNSGATGTVYASGAEAMETIAGRYDIVSVSTSIVGSGESDGSQTTGSGAASVGMPCLRIELRKPGQDTAYDKWMQKYKEETGGEVSFF